MELLKKYHKVIQMAAALAGTYGVCYLLKIAGMEKASFSVLGIFFLIGIYVLLEKTAASLSEVSDKKLLKRRICYAVIVSFLFSLTMIMGYQLQTFDMTECGVKGKGLILLRAIALGIAVFPFGNLLFTGIEKIGLRRDTSAQDAGFGKPWKNASVFAVSAAVIFVCLIPVWLAYYPIIMSYDFHRQINEAVKGFVWFVPYQPLLHTWVIWVFVQVGYLVGDLQAGMGCMALFHMLTYSLVAGYGISFVYRIVKKKWAVVVGVLFFGIFPLNSVMVICTTKDVLFSVLFLLFILLFAERLFFCEGKRKLVFDILLVVEGSLMMQFRNNAIYAVAAFALVWLIFSAKKEKLHIFLMCLILLLGGKGTSILVKEALGTSLSPFEVEKYSVPIQQFARVGYYHGDTLDEETEAIINTYLRKESWPDYNAFISDGMKSSVGVYTFTESWQDNTAQWMSDWLKIGLKYPNEYIDAFLELTRGYWFLDDRSYADELGYGLEERLGIIYTYNSTATEEFEGIEHESKFLWLEEKLENIVSANAFYDWPVVSVLFKASFYFWGLCLVFAANLYLRQREHALISSFLLLYMGTMFLGPVAWLRYVFPIMLTLPVILGMLFLKRTESAINK